MVKDIIVIDNFLDRNLFLKIQESVNSYKQEWYLVPNISLCNTENPKKNYGFYSILVDEDRPEEYYDTESSEYIFTLNENIKSKFGFNHLVRCRLDMTTYRGEEQITFNPHIDLEGLHQTSIYYTNECNAPTIIYNEKTLFAQINLNINLTEKKRIYPKENRLVVFPGNHIHTGMCATDVSHRILINSNFR